MSTLLIAGTATSGASLSADTTGSLQIQTGSSPTTAITVDTSQNVGIGITPSAWGSTFKALQLGTTNSLYATGSRTFAIANNTYNNGTASLYLSTGAASVYLQSDNNHFWYNAPSGTAGTTATFTQAMTLDSSGNLLVGTTTNTTNTKGIISYDGSVNNGFALIDSTGTTAGTRYALFIQRGTGTTVGSISTTTSTTSFNTSSDYRLKENVALMTGALETVAKLKPVTYDWISDKTKGQGFIAHELQAVVPDCVTGEKDAVDAEGKPIYQGIDTSFLVATLTAAIQEQQAIITDLQTRIETLEAK